MPRSGVNRLELSESIRPTKKTQFIRQDGQQYEFTPGKNGSLIVRGNRRPPTPLVGSSMAAPRSRAKVIMPSKSRRGQM